MILDRADFRTSNVSTNETPRIGHPNPMRHDRTTTRLKPQLWIIAGAIVVMVGASVMGMIPSG